MAHRVVEIAWTPHSKKGWATFTASRLEAARLWSDLVTRHHRLRRLQWKWPNEPRWNKSVKGKYPNLSAQSVQQIVAEFLEAVKSVSTLRKKGHVEARYPWRTPRYHDVTYTNQDARLKGSYLILPHGKRGAGNLAVKIPKGLTLPGRMMEVRLEYGRVLIVCKIEDEKPVGGEVVVGVDLGVNTLACATDGVTAVAISGRGVKAVIRYRNKKLASLRSAIDTKERGSRRRKRLRRRMYRVIATSANRVRDLCHKASRKIVEAFPRARIIVGQPFNDAAQKMGRRQAQQVSQACTRKLISLLDYKAKGATVVPEPYSSQTCPVCGGRQKCRRTYVCKACGFSAPRDVVGALNIRQIGMTGGLSPTPGLVAPAVTFKHPTKYPGSRQVVRPEPPQVARTA